MKLPHMRLLLLAGLLGTLLSTPASAVTLTKTLSIDPEDVTRRERGGIVSLELAGAVQGMRPGQPDLPVLPVRFLLPAGTRLGEVRVVGLAEITLSPVRELGAVGKPDRPD